MNVLMTQEIANRIMTAIVAEYYNFYRCKVSTPFLYEELVDKATLEHIHDVEACCGFPREIMEQLAPLVFANPLVDNPDIDKSFIDSSVADFIKDNSRDCALNKKITLERQYRLGTQQCEYMYVGDKYVDVCKFLAISIFTSEYANNPNAFDKLVAIMKYGICEGLDTSESAFSEEELNEFEGRMKGNIGTKSNIQYEWMILFDQTFIMYMEYLKKNSFNLKIHRAWNKNKNKSERSFKL